MPTESGDNKLIGNFRKLIDEVSAELAYNSANNKLKTTALESQYNAADNAVNAVAAARAPNKLAITDREDTFKGLGPHTVRSRNFLKASGASKGVVDDAEEFILKGATAEGRSISSEEILESRREMWGEYMREDET
ncbi:MAG TPA: hypothetical protein VGO68_13950 [Pyrinomonadaceae bacterium]|jgi:hypothetical protein|nr:hypothetical protein [Pyrinomonadaceae bacterium]